MSNSFWRQCLVAMLCLCCITSALAQARKDAAGGRDGPLLSRYQGSWLIAYRNQGFAEVEPLNMLTDEIAKERKLDRTLAVEGEVGEWFYVSPKGRTALEVQRNYEAALIQAGAKILYSCKGIDYGCYDRGGPASQWLLDGVIPRNQQVSSINGAYYAFGALADNLRLSVFKLVRGGASIYITVYSVDAPKDDQDFGGAAATYLQIVQPKEMDAGKVEVFDATLIASGLKTEGKIAIYGIYFDIGKADIKPDSKPQLDQMAKALTQNAALKVFVVGHTDNQGNVDANIALSQRRAEAVVIALTRDYKIDAKRLSAKGVANFAPVSSNDSEPGKAKNRRVEIVVQ